MLKVFMININRRKKVFPFWTNEQRTRKNILIETNGQTSVRTCLLVHTNNSNVDNFRFHFLMAPRRLGS